MTGACLALIVVLGQTPAADPQQAVARLGTARYADREAASKALEKLGRRALPALRAAREVRDPEIRARAAALVTRIEGALLTQPSMVSLDFEGASLTEVVKSFHEQTGIRLTLIPENPAGWRLRKVTLRDPDPQPFWKAIDRLCDAANLQYNFGMHTVHNGREPGFPLFDGGGRPALPSSDTGPFRVSVVSLHYQRDVTFPPAPQVGRDGPGPFPRLRPKPDPVAANVKPAPAFNEQFYAQLQVAGEPRLALSQSGPMRITEAVDDKGQAAPPATSPATSHRTAGYFGFATGSAIQIQAPLNRPATPGSAIRKLKGVVPVTVSTRKPNPLTVTLNGSAGRTFQNEDVILTIHDVVAKGANRLPGIEISVRPGVAGGGSAGAFMVNDAIIVRPDSYQQQIEVVDANARALPWYQTSFDAESGRMTMTLTSPDQATAPSELRYYSLVRATTDVSFEFKDVPMP